MKNLSTILMTVFAILSGAIVLIGYLFPIPGLVTIRDTFTGWAMVLATIAILLGVELMLNAVNINLVSFWRYSDVFAMGGQVFSIIVFAVAAAEVSVGLALVISVYRRRNTVVADEVEMLKW